jgi:transcription factor MYB, plant
MAREMAAGLFSHAPPVAAEQEVVAEDGCEVEHGLGSGRGKLCARGHWRPAEDAKLKELVAQHGPQNWNLIAEKLDGRSGNQRNTIMWWTV